MYTGEDRTELNPYIPIRRSTSTDFLLGSALVESKILDKTRGKNLEPCKLNFLFLKAANTFGSVNVSNSCSINIGIKTSASGPFWIVAAKRYWSCNSSATISSTYSGEVVFSNSFAVIPIAYCKALVF